MNFDFILNFNSIPIFLILMNSIICENKYSKELNEKGEDVIFRKLDKPFRMNKMNTLWKKAQLRLTEPKLKSLYSELLVLDKEEITFKRFKSEGGDKEGLKEAELRTKLKNIMLNYGLMEHFEDNAPPRLKDQVVTGEKLNKQLFKDKKLNEMWAKAERSGFSLEELSLLKEEFAHHQDKIDQYYELLDLVESGKQDSHQNAVDEDELVNFNEIIGGEGERGAKSKDFLHQSNLVRDSHRELRDGYDKLHRITAQGPDNREFVEPEVQGLWRLATQANFSTEELASFKVELQHYESRVLKLRALLAAGAARGAEAEGAQQLSKQHARKVDKMHAELEARVRGRPRTDL